MVSAMAKAIYNVKSSHGRETGVAEGCTRGRAKAGSSEAGRESPGAHVEMFALHPALRAPIAGGLDL